MIDSPHYQLVERDHDVFAKSGRHRHRLRGVSWKAAAASLKYAIAPKELKENFGLAHPIQTKSKVQQQKAEALMKEMGHRFRRVDGSAHASPLGNV